MPAESKVIRGEESQPTFRCTPMTLTSSDAIGRTVFGTSSHAVDVSGRESDGKSSPHYPDLSWALVSRRVINDGKPNTLRPASTRSVSRERGVGCIGAFAFPGRSGVDESADRSARTF